ncbi:unnamed protein product [Toxocara canis]|uniref:Galectin n=1 Tax=Toxocara canis TaxID=6265 RepID=A0A183UTK0_TOXCA|nr:unnamed protein product [Toxocara canis]
MEHPGDVAVPVPYVSRLTQKLQPGQTLVIHGTVNNDAKRFEVNLLSGSSEIGSNSQVMLHVSVRFDEGKVVFNSMENGTWGKEERVSNPFKPGQEFDLRIRIHEDKFEISANHKEIHEFKFRLPYSSIEYFVVRGDVKLKGVHWGGRYYTLPFETQFEDGHLASGQRVYVYGTPKGERFNIDFIARNGDILFHFNPRFKEKKVVRNAEIGKAWGAEEREGPFPFKKDIGFDLVFLNEPYSIQIFHDGERMGTFAHRTKNPGEDYIGLRVAGDLELTGLEFSQH